MKIFENLEEIRKCVKPYDWWTETFTFKFSIPLVSLISKTKITPNQLTLISLFIVIAASLLIARGGYVFLIIGALLLQVGYMFDHVDGQLARYKKIFSPLGEWLDSTSDRIKESLIILSLTYRYSQISDRALFFGFYSLFLIFLYHTQEGKKLPFTDPKSKKFIEGKERGIIKRLNAVRRKLKLIPFNIGEQYFLFSFFIILNRIDLFFYFFMSYGSIVTISFPLYKYYQYRLSKSH